MLYLKGLNGIRTIAAFGVLISHIKMLSLGFTETINRTLAGPYGVTMFFALSGFLITYLLLKEKEKSGGRIEVKKFYLRRILRIWPLYFLYLLISIIVLFIYYPGLLFTNSTIFYFILMANVPMALNVSLPLIGHYWSLGTEEQFYLFWPWLVRIKNEFKVLVIFLSFFVGLKLFMHFVVKDRTIDYFFDLLRFDCMAIGALGAVLISQYKNKIKIIYNPIIQVIAWLFVGAVAINRFHIISVIDHDIFAVITTIIVINQCTNDKVLLSLDNKVCEFLGKISFGIYVYHPLIIFLYVKLLDKLNISDGFLKSVLLYAGVIALTIGIAYISFEYFEKYFLKKRTKFAVVESRSFKG